jgi:hypothetical protein
VKWIWFRKYYFRICRTEKLREIKRKEVEDHKYEEEATPTYNELHDIHSLFSMNPTEFVKMNNVCNHIKNNKIHPIHKD